MEPRRLYSRCLLADYVAADELVVELAQREHEALRLIFRDDGVTGFHQLQRGRLEVHVLVFNLRHGLGAAFSYPLLSSSSSSPAPRPPAEILERVGGARILTFPR